MRALECTKVYSNESGWDVLVDRELARSLLIEGFIRKKIYTGIQVGRRNYNQDDGRRGNYEKKDRYGDRDAYRPQIKYVEKNKEDQQDESHVTSEFTFQSSFNRI